jgi:hypothetical protein
VGLVRYPAVDAKSGFSEDMGEHREEREDAIQSEKESKVDTERIKDGDDSEDVLIQRVFLAFPELADSCLEEVIERTIANIS